MKTLQYFICLFFIFSCKKETPPLPLIEAEKPIVIPDYEVLQSNDSTQLIKWNNAGIIVEFPKKWMIRNTVFGDSVKNQKTGELMPGLMTPKEPSLTGEGFLSRFKNYGSIEFEEGKFVMDGLPSKIMHTDSIQLKNAYWYIGISESGYEGDDYGTWYPYLYYGDFGKKKMLIQFYRYDYNLKDTLELNNIVETIKLID